MVRALVGDSTMTRVDMEISKKRVAVELNSQIEVILVKCQGKISSLVAVISSLHKLPVSGKIPKTSDAVFLRAYKQELLDVNFQLFPSLTYLGHNWRLLLAK